MANNAKLVSDLQVLLRAVRAHEGSVSARAAQAADPQTRAMLDRTAEQEHRLADQLAARARTLGAFSPRLRPTGLPSATSLVVGVAGAVQPLGEALLADAAQVRALADRARVAGGLAAALKHPPVQRVTGELDELYRTYADWLVDTAATLVVDEDNAALTPTGAQRIAGHIKDLVGLPARIAADLEGRADGAVTAGTERISELLGRGRSVRDSAGKVVDAAWTAGSDAAFEQAEHEAGRRGADAAHAVHTVGEVAGTTPARDLPIADYDDKSAAQAAGAVRRLDDIEQIVTVAAYERHHRGRKTVLDAAQARADAITG